MRRARGGRDGHMNAVMIGCAEMEAGVCVCGSDGMFILRVETHAGAFKHICHNLSTIHRNAVHDIVIQV